MSHYDAIRSLPCGAGFFRADLHIHSYSASHDVKDGSMTPERIVEEAAQESLSAIAITDHNEIANIERALAAAAGTAITVIPGIELSTPEGHLLVYLRSYDALARFYGRLEFRDRGRPDSRCTTSMLDCLKSIDEKNGFAILAHVDGGNGLEKKLPGAPPHKRDILAEPALLGIELASATSTISYSDADPDQVRKELGRHRVEKLGLGPARHLARVLFSDSHRLDHLGRNSQADHKVTRFKAQAADFDGLRMALLFPDARVRIEEEVPATVPYLEGVEIHGGFLDGQHVRFNRNLTCIIGGRGTGKSTLLEAARSIAAGKSTSSLVDCEVWPDALGVFWRDQAGEITTIRREKHRDAENVDDPFGLTCFGVECYSQNEISVKTDSAALLRFLDQFIDFGETKERDIAACKALADNEQELSKIQTEVDRLPEERKRLSDTKRQFEALKAAKGTDIIELERKLAAETVLRQNAAAALKTYTDAAVSSPEKDLLKQLSELAGPDDVEVGAPVWKAMLAAAQVLGESAAPLRAELDELRKKLLSEMRNQFKAWKAADVKTRTEIQEKRDELEAQGVKLEIAYVRKLAHDLERLTSSVLNLESKKRELEAAVKRHAKLAEQRSSCLADIGTRRDGYATLATEALRGTLGELKLAVKFKRGCLSPAAESIIKQAMGWRTNQVPRAAEIVRQLSVPRLLDAIRSNDLNALTTLKVEGEPLLGRRAAQEVLDTLSRDEHRRRLERCAVQDLPQILISAVPAGRAAPVTRDFSKLSLGQQQSVLLSLMLTSSSQSPLIIDQPEDNLDSEFIYRSLVAAEV